MSDMLQLVVLITYPQSGYHPLRRTSSVANHDDKLDEAYRTSGSVFVDPRLRPLDHVGGRLGQLSCHEQYHRGVAGGFGRNTLSRTIRTNPLPRLVWKPRIGTQMRVELGQAHLPNPEIF